MFAIFVAQMAHGSQPLAKEIAALLVNALAQRGYETDQLHTSLPREKFPHMLVNYRFGFGDFAFARAAILLHDVREIIQVVDIDVVDFARCGLDIAWDGE